MSYATSRMTELEAVNLILQAIDEPPVASLSLTGLLPLERAKSALRQASLLVQSSGWSFNREENYPLSRDVDGLITLPDNLIRLDVNNEHTGVDPALRGARLYDKLGHTYTFTADLKATVIFHLSWDELPQPARHYIALHAAAFLQSTMSVSERLAKGVAEEKEAVWLALSGLESDEGDHNMLTGSLSVLRALSSDGMLLESY